MSDDAEEPDILEEEATEPLPEILVYSMGSGLIGATVSVLIDAKGSNLGESYKTQLVMGRDPGELNDRVVSVLVAQFGLSQDDAQAAMDSATAVVPADGSGPEYLPLDGSVPMLGPLYLSGDPVDAPDDSSDVLATTKHYVDAANNLKMNTFGIGDASEAAGGEIGEYMVVSNTVGVTLPTTVPTMICQLSLTPGDWEIWGAIDFVPAAGVSPNMVAASVSVHPDALPSDTDLMEGVGILNMITTNSLTAGQRQMLMTGQCRSNQAAPLDVYLVGQTTLGGSGLLTAKGYICARRVR
jgi:hypothetical protein